MKIGIVSLGCAKNQVDTEQMLSLFTKEGWEITNRSEEADVLVVNTCGFIASAKEESIDAILEMAEYKKTGRCRVLCVTGCLAQRYREELFSEIPEIDCLLGVYGYGNVVDAIRKALEGQRVNEKKEDRGFLECGRVLTTPFYSAYVRIGEGCNNRCAYCAIPLIRGDYRSRSRESILKEMRSLAAGGAREQLLISQDTSVWGRDLGDDLGSLMEEACGIDGLDWLRVLYMYPDEIDLSLLERMAKQEKICRYLDLPLQHASPRLLKSMNRRGSMESTRRLLHTAREMGFTLRTTFIVGFPGETEEDFERLMDFTEEIGFDRMGAFTFSPEEDTKAYSLPDPVPEEIRQERLDRLMTLQAGISLARNRARLGHTEKVLVCEGLTGRSAAEAPDADGVIRLISRETLEPGTFVNARITEADTYDLTAEVE